MIIHFYFIFIFFFGGGLCVQPQAVVCLSGVQFQEYMEDLGVSVFSIQSETFASTTPTSATLRQAKSKLETWLARYVFFFLFFIFQVCKNPPCRNAFACGRTIDHIIQKLSPSVQARARSTILSPAASTVPRSLIEATIAAAAAEPTDDTIDDAELAAALDFADDTLLPPLATVPIATAPPQALKRPASATEWFEDATTTAELEDDDESVHSTTFAHAQQTSLAVQSFQPSTIFWGYVSGVVMASRPVDGMVVLVRDSVVNRRVLVKAGKHISTMTSAVLPLSDHHLSASSNATAAWIHDQCTRHPLSAIAKLCASHDHSVLTTAMNLLSHKSMVRGHPDLYESFRKAFEVDLGMVKFQFSLEPMDYKEARDELPQVPSCWPPNAVNFRACSVRSGGRPNGNSAGFHKNQSSTPSSQGTPNMRAAVHAL